MTQAPPGRREKRKQEIRTRIEDAAYELFQRQGIDNTSIEEICLRAGVARRTFYGHYPNKHALLAGLGISRLYSQAEPMLRSVMARHRSTRARLEGMIEYIAAAFADYHDIDRELILIAPSAFADNAEQQREIGNAATDAFARLISAGLELGDVSEEFSPEMLAAMVVGTLNVLTMNWAMDSDYPVFARLQEARRMFERLICRAGA